MRLYGWNDLNDKSYGIAYVDTPEELPFRDFDEETGEYLAKVDPDSGLGQLLGDGRWFDCFSKAKDAQIRELQVGCRWIKFALTFVRNQKKCEAWSGRMDDE
jgi:hypothetical protein